MRKQGFTVALTGGIGSGKSAAALVFTQLGVPIVDLDIISHQLTAAKNPVLDAIVDTFGPSYVAKDGALDRGKMRDLVFNDKTALAQLNTILHPAIYKEAVDQLAQYTQAPYAILVIPLLDQESPYLSIIDRILTIDCAEATQVARVQSRSQLNKTQINNIIAAQTPRQTRIQMADDLVENNGNIEELSDKIAKLHQKYMKTCIVSKTIS